MFIPRGENSLLFKIMEGQTKNYPPPGDNFTPRGILRHWASKFAPMGEVKTGLQFFTRVF
jgi:hypothetical protein